MADLMKRFGDAITDIADGLDDEGDRVYLRSTNDADLLRELRDAWFAVRLSRAPDPRDEAIRALVEALEAAEELYRVGLICAPAGLIDNVVTLRRAALAKAKEAGK